MLACSYGYQTAFMLYCGQSGGSSAMSSDCRLSVCQGFKGIVCSKIRILSFTHPMYPLNTKRDLISFFNVALFNATET